MRPGDAVRTACRKAYCHPHAIKSSKRKLTSDCADSSCTLRSQKSFSYKDNCLFCGMPDRYGGKKRQFELIPDRTLHFDTAILKVCDERNDEWSEEVKVELLLLRTSMLLTLCTTRLAVLTLELEGMCLR